MKKLMMLVVIAIVILNANVFSIDTEAKGNYINTDGMIPVQERVWMYTTDSNGSKHYTTYVYTDYYPAELGYFMIQTMDEYYAIKYYGGVDDETILNFQINKYTDKLYDLSEKYPENVNLEALGL